MREEDDQLYIYKLYGISGPRRIKADKSLRSRIGPKAQITESQIQKAQDILENPHVDFRPHAMAYIKKIQDAVDMLRVESFAREEDYDLIVSPLIQIKGQAAMFGNPLVSEISSRILKFVEHYQKLDNDMLDLLNVYCRTVKMAYDKDLKDANATGSRILLDELSQAMERYRVKFNKKTGRE